jgi:hypothetical protein
MRLNKQLNEELLCCFGWHELLCMIKNVVADFLDVSNINWLCSFVMVKSSLILII